MKTRHVVGGAGIAALALAAACGDDLRPTFIAVTMNTGTNPGLPHDAPPDDGYGAEQAAYSDQYYGDGLAWRPVIDDTRAFFDRVRPDVVAFQEIFASEECPTVDAAARPGFVCETWTDGDPTVAQLVVGPDYQVACHDGHHDKCVAVKRGFGTIRGCGGDLCLDGGAGVGVPGCGTGARVARFVVDRAVGSPLTLVSVHGTSGLAPADVDCRVAQVEQVFVDLGLGDGPGTSGDHNLVLGDFNTDPGRAAAADASAARWNDFAGAGHAFHFISEVGPEAPPSYADLLDIDHVLGDTQAGSCWIAGVTPGHDAVTGRVFFDHKPVVCNVELPD
jgi:hypothetical protein